MRNFPTKKMIVSLCVPGMLAACGPTEQVTPTTPTTTAAETVQQCVQRIGWQLDYLVDSDYNGIPDEHEAGCDDAATATWFEETEGGASFRQVMAWNSDLPCSARSPAPATDAELCEFLGGHAWSAIAGVEPSKRMALVETVATVHGDFDGDGADDKCGPASVMENTQTRYLVELAGPCASGTKVWFWQPLAGDTEERPGDMFHDVNGAAQPAVLCTKPGTIGPADHLPNRKICGTQFVVADVDP